MAYQVYKKMDLVNRLNLLDFFNNIWKNGTRPEAWQSSIVIPIPKDAKAKIPDKTRRLSILMQKLLTKWSIID